MVLFEVYVFLFVVLTENHWHFRIRRPCGAPPKDVFTKVDLLTKTQEISLCRFIFSLTDVTQDDFKRGKSSKLIMGFR